MPECRKECSFCNFVSSLSTFCHLYIVKHVLFCYIYNVVYSGPCSMSGLVSPLPQVMFGLMTSFHLVRSGTKNKRSRPGLQVKRSNGNDILQEMQTGLLPVS